MSINEITGDKLQSKLGDEQSQEAYAKGWDTIFSKSERKRRAVQQGLPLHSWVLGEPATEVKQEPSGGCCGGCC